MSPARTRPERLTRRADYLAAGRGRRFHAPRLSVHGCERAASRTEDPGSARFGLTVSRKVGNAVERNRVKRRLREALRRLAGQPEGEPGRANFDYVVVAHREALNAGFDQLVHDIAAAVERLHRPRRQGGAPHRPPPQTRTH